MMTSITSEPPISTRPGYGGTAWRMVTGGTTSESDGEYTRATFSTTGSGVAAGAGAGAGGGAIALAARSLNPEASIFRSDSGGCDDTLSMSGSPRPASTCEKPLAAAG